MINVQAPLATYTGCGLRRAGFAENEDCGLTGQYIPLAKTKAECLASGDPRPSVEERYGNLSYYLWLRLNAVADLVNKRYLLPEDAFAEYTSGAAAARARGLSETDSDQSQRTAGTCLGSHVTVARTATGALEAASPYGSYE